jgi:exportin-1
MHATILAYMFLLIERGKIHVPLGPAPDNTLYIQEFVARLLRAAFPHLTDNQIKITVQGLFHLNQDITAFKEHLRDFLVQIKVSNI